MGLSPQPWGGQRGWCPGPGPVPGVRPERAQRQRAIERGGMCAPRSQHPEQDSAHPSDRQTDRRRAPTHSSRSGSGPVPPRGVERATKRNCGLCSGFSRFPTNDPTPSRDETPGPHRAATAPAAALRPRPGRRRFPGFTVSPTLPASQGLLASPGGFLCDRLGFPTRRIPSPVGEHEFYALLPSVCAFRASFELHSAGRNLPSVPDAWTSSPWPRPGVGGTCPRLHRHTRHPAGSSWMPQPRRGPRLSLLACREF